MENNKPQYSRFKLYLPVIMAMVLVAGFLLGLYIRPKEAQTERKFFSIGFDRNNQLNNIINFIQEAYVDSVDREILTEDAIHSLLKNLDPHSAYIPARDFREMNDPLMGSFEGIGIEFNMISDTVVVINPIAGGPSEKAGIMPGDRIVKVEDEVIAGVNMSTNDIVKRLKGEKGTTVNVEVVRSGVSELLPFSLIRDQIPQYSLDVAYMVDEEVGYIRLNKFSATTHQEFILAMERLKREGMQKMILDLRGNGGGFLEAAINLSDEFLDAQKLIVYTDGRSRPRQYAHARRNGVFETQPLVILIDEWSASASEIVAGAVQDNDRGLIIGRRSFGKGLVQEQVQLGDGSALRLTVARYYTPTGRSIQKPYEDGEEEYFNEFMNRLMEGELENPDSIKFNDSLKFETPAGRVVYGGGGIMPDLFIPIESGEEFVFYNQVANRGLVYRFAFNYADRNREALHAYENEAAFVRDFSISQAIYRDFMDFAREEGVSIPAQISAESQDLIRRNLKAYIGRNIFGAEAFFPVLHEDDQAFLKAVEVLKSNTYESMLQPPALP
ncbi:MAG: S41 family peptidase [Bacteroides sp.]|jgi:carboxyl-terminal processing protease|nr:S41 family peptidase [Bacteroides sp.]